MGIKKNTQKTIFFDIIYMSQHVIEPTKNTTKTQSLKSNTMAKQPQSGEQRLGLLLPTPPEL